MKKKTMRSLPKYKKGTDEVKVSKKYNGGAMPSGASDMSESEYTNMRANTVLDVTDPKPSRAEKLAKMEEPSLFETTKPTVTTKAKSPTGLVRGGTEAVAAYQRKLNKAGYNIKVDGAWSPDGETQAAYTDYMSKRKKPSIGASKASPSGSMKTPKKSAARVQAPATVAPMAPTTSVKAKTNAVGKPATGKMTAAPLTMDNSARSDASSYNPNIAAREVGRKKTTKFYEELDKVPDQNADDFLKNHAVTRNIYGEIQRHIAEKKGFGEGVGYNGPVSKKDYKEYVQAQQESNDPARIALTVGGGILGGLTKSKAVAGAIMAAPIIYNQYKDYEADKADGEVDWKDRGLGLVRDVASTFTGSVVGKVGKGAVKAKMANINARAAAVDAKADVKMLSKKVKKATNQGNTVKADKFQTKLDKTKKIAKNKPDNLSVGKALSNATSETLGNLPGVKQMKNITTKVKNTNNKIKKANGEIAKDKLDAEAKVKSKEIKKATKKASKIANKSVAKLKETGKMRGKPITENPKPGKQVSAADRMNQNLDVSIQAKRKAQLAKGRATQAAKKNEKSID